MFPLCLGSENGECVKYRVFYIWTKVCDLTLRPLVECQRELFMLDVVLWFDSVICRSLIMLNWVRNALKKKKKKI